jgi:ketosteroid isomerase-like protein
MGKESTTRPSANVDLVRSIFAAWERGDYDSAEWAHPQIEFIWADGPNPGCWSGLAGMAVGMRSYLIAWDDARIGDVDAYRELDGERVLVLYRVSGRGKSSGIELGQLGVAARQAQLFHVRNGSVTRLVVYFDRERALADLGLKG